MGYTRTTQRAKYSRSYRRYMDYKDAVVAAFLEQVPGEWGHPKPLTTTKGSKTRVDIKIYFKNFVHPDGDNVFKACLDSLFACDKYCSGSYDFGYDAKNPRVEVRIR
jgi:Endodeoxyribonuclease RusA